MNARTRAGVSPVPPELRTPLSAAMLVAVAGGAGMAMGNPWLFPCLGPTAMLQAHAPHARSAGLRSVVAGHALGLACGYGAVLAWGAHAAPAPLAGGRLAITRVLAAVLAVALTVGLQYAARALHAPGMVTALLVALGAFAPTLRDALHVAAGIGTLGVAGELLRRARGGRA